MKVLTKTQKNMKQPAGLLQEPGYISLLGVFTLAILMFAMLLFAYERAINSQSVQANVQAQTDYREKEETVLRSIVAITPNRAILAMQNGSFADQDQETNPLSFRNIFFDALSQANARQSISDEVREQLAIPNSFSGNTGDSNLDDLDLIFGSQEENDGFVTGGLNRNYSPGFPPVLDSANIIAEDDLFPIISNVKKYGNRANGNPAVTLPTSTYSDFNIIPYPNINFGYTSPGAPFVAKRNWWAFRMNMAGSDDALTGLARLNREFVLSVYEIPSQLPISASSYMAFGQHADGTNWQNVSITGNVFAGRAKTEGNFNLASLATRRGAEFTGSSTIGGIGTEDFSDSPFEGDFREQFRNDQGGLFPISLSSESGKAAFVPINRGAAYFDRFAHLAETNTISPTTWNNYSVGALQCAMNLDITDCVSTTDRTPTKMVFRYIKGGVKTEELINLTSQVAGLPPGYIKCAVENQTVNFASRVDVAYGRNGQFFFKKGVSGSFTFNNATFGDPIPGIFKDGYYKIAPNFETKVLPSGQICIAIFPELLKAYLLSLGGDGLDVNNSISVNVNYDVTRGGSSKLLPPPSIPCTEDDYGLILQQCADLSDFTKGFSIVTNLRTYIGDDFNVVETTPPTGYVPPDGRFFPPCSLFSPEKRYGTLFNPTAVELTGQIGSVASEKAANPVRPLDAFGVTGDAMEANRITMNLSTIRHPVELPPIFMMNWLVVVEEKR